MIDGEDAVAAAGAQEEGASGGFLGGEEKFEGRLGNLMDALDPILARLGHGGGNARSAVQGDSAEFIRLGHKMICHQGERDGESAQGQVKTGFYNVHTIGV